VIDLAEKADETVAIRTEGLVKVFPGDVRAVDGLDIEVRRGEVFGFLGPNGAGKTTSIRMMTGLLKPTSGRVTIEGESIERASKGIRRRIGVCPQEIVLWNLLTCLENLALIANMYDVPGREGKRRAAELLDDLELSDKSDALADTLSGGMKRRLNVAMALVHDPDIVVLDEPTAGLDPQSRLVVKDHIDRIKKEEKTIILTTHMMEIADQLSDRVAIIDHGKLLRLDTPANLRKQIGEGDVMDIAMMDESRSPVAAEALQGLEGLEEVRELPGGVSVRALNVTRRLPEIFQSLDAADAKVRDVSMRSNSLEDVFISLTGRKLRE
jgi:ABC-2 type transport system ATP-binding protein